ncbi:MAG: hypothetical protein AB8B53_09910 [Flavobacteriales bacterium]
MPKDLGNSIFFWRSERVYWQDKRVGIIYDMLLDLSPDDWFSLEREFLSLTKKKKFVLLDVVGCVLKGSLGSDFSEEFKIRAPKLFFLGQDGYAYIFRTAFSKGYIVESRTKSKNLKVLDLYYFLLQNSNVDSDFWNLGGLGDLEIQTKLIIFSEYDWKFLSDDIVNWTHDERQILFESITESETISFFYSESHFITESVWVFLRKIYETKNGLLFYEGFGRFIVQFISALNESTLILKEPFLKGMKQWLIEHQNEFNDEAKNSIDNINKLLEKNRQSKT